MLFYSIKYLVDSEGCFSIVKKLPLFFLGSATRQAPTQMFRAAPIKA